MRKITHLWRKVRKSPKQWDVPTSEDAGDMIARVGIRKRGKLYSGAYLIRCQDAVCQQAQTTEVGKTRSLGNRCQHGKMEFGREIDQREVFYNGAFDGAPIKGVRYLSHAGIGVGVQQMSEPEGIEATSNDHMLKHGG